MRMFLKECPFCGDADVTLFKFYETCDGIGDKYPKIVCNKCNASIALTNDEIKKIDDMHDYKGGYRSQCKGLLEAYHSELIAKWNRRTEKHTDRITDPCWKNLDPWEMCGQDKFCNRGCHEEGGCTNGCIVPTIYTELAKREDKENESESNM